MELEIENRIDSILITVPREYLMRSDLYEVFASEVYRLQEEEQCILKVEEIYSTPYNFTDTVLFKKVWEA